MDVHRSFALNNFKRSIEKCSDVKELREMTFQTMQLYLQQQDTISELIKKGWLPEDVQT
tara:strand:+ start:241 stop:417 length:177 start_codon:yes stop_codon:yes gene_type:complete